MEQAGSPEIKRRQTEKLKEALHNTEYHSDVMWWLMEISEIVEADEAPSVGYVGTYDYIIANAYASMLQVLYLYAEKEGVIEQFSEGLDNTRDVFGLDEEDINVPLYIVYEYVRVMAEKYGWEFPVTMNYSVNNEEYSPQTSVISELEPNLIKAMLCSSCCDRDKQKELNEYVKYIKTYHGFGTDDYIRSRIDVDAVACMVNPRWNDLQRRYANLPADIKERLSVSFHDTQRCISRVTSCAEDDYLVSGDSFTDDTGCQTDVCYIRYCQPVDHQSEWYTPPLIHCFCSYRLGRLMAEADLALRDFEKMIISA